MQATYETHPRDGCAPGWYSSPGLRDRTDATKGLGRFRLGPTVTIGGRPHASWIYITPRGLECFASSQHGQYLDEPLKPPPLPQPEAERRQCGCWRGPHTCGECGQPYWIEIHGMADGYCTYCYYRG